MKKYYSFAGQTVAMKDAATGAITGGGVQMASNIHDDDPSTKPFDNVLAASWKGASYGALAYGASTGDEITISKNFRIAPFGNRTENEYGELPHYHQRYIDPESGGTIPGGGISRHRPWE